MYSAQVPQCSTNKTNLSRRMHRLHRIYSKILPQLDVSSDILDALCELIMFGSNQLVFQVALSKFETEILVSHICTKKNFVPDLFSFSVVSVRYLLSGRLVCFRVCPILIILILVEFFIRNKY